MTKESEAPAARVQLLRWIAEEAVRSVQFIKDPGLRRAAFEKNLDTLLDERFKMASKASARSAPEAASESVIRGGGASLKGK